MSFFEPRGFVERVFAQRQAEQMAQAHITRELHCKCGNKLKASNQTGECFRCTNRKARAEAYRESRRQQAGAVDNKLESRHSV